MEKEKNSKVRLIIKHDYIFNHEVTRSEYSTLIIDSEVLFRILESSPSNVIGCELVYNEDIQKTKG